MNYLNTTIHNRYKISERIGLGAMGEVYLAEDLLKNNNNIALKTIKTSFLEKKENQALSNFKKEYEIMERLDHPNIVKVYGFGSDSTNGLNYIVMEYLNGCSLREYLDKNKNLSIKNAVKIFV